MSRIYNRGVFVDAVYFKIRVSHIRGSEVTTCMIS